MKTKIKYRDAARLNQSPVHNFFQPKSIIGSGGGFFRPGYGSEFSDTKTVFNQNHFSSETYNDLQQETMNQSVPAPAPQKPPTAAPGKECTEPTSVTIDQSRTQQMQYPDYGTGANLAGICVVMKAFPETDNLCPSSIYKEVKPTEE